MELRFARPADSADLLAIYARYIDTPITFEYDLPTEAEFARRIRNFGTDYPYLAAEEQGKLLGYAYAHRQAERAAYQWNAELSIYLAPEATSRGLGKTLYSALMELLRLQGIRTVYGVVTVPNEKSEGLHRAMGFTLAGIHHATGYKNGRWHDVAWFEKHIAPCEKEPRPIVSLGEVPEAVRTAVLERFSL